MKTFRALPHFLPEGCGATRRGSCEKHGQRVLSARLRGPYIPVKHMLYHSRVVAKAFLAWLTCQVFGVVEQLVTHDHCIAARRGRGKPCSIELIDELERPAARLARASTSDACYSGWTTQTSLLLRAGDDIVCVKYVEMKLLIVGTNDIIPV